MTAARDLEALSAPVVPLSRPWVGATGTSGWFQTAEWEVAADWDVPEEWRRLDDVSPLGLPLGAGETLPPAPRAYPRRRDLRERALSVELELAVEEALAPALREWPLDGPDGPDGAGRPDDDAAPAPVRPTPVAYPRRRDVHRPGARTARPRRRPTVRVAARAGVVAALVAATAASVTGTVGLADLTFGEGRDVTAAEAAQALRLAPLPATRTVDLWDPSSDLAGAKAAAGVVRTARAEAAAKAAAEAAARAAAAEAAKKEAAAAKAAALAAAEARREARARALRGAQRDARGLGELMAADRGWTGSQWRCLDLLWTRESNWRWNADNPRSSAYGIPQALPGRKMASAGSDWLTNPRTQIEWGLDYIADRYGTPCGAWSHSQATGWY